MKERLESYIEQSNHKLLSKLPVIIHMNGRNFEKLTSLLDKPYSEDLASCFEFVLNKLCNELEGCVFGYAFNDELLFILRNDQSRDTQPWYDNKIQKINSVSTSLAIYHFLNSINSIDLTILGDPVFITNVFTVPNISEAYNYLIYSQNKNFIKSLNISLESELLKQNFNRQEIKDMLKGLSIEERKKLLLDKCDIEYLSYPSQFRRGIYCSKFSGKFETEYNSKVFVEDKNNILAILSKIY